MDSSVVSDAELGTQLPNDERIWRRVKVPEQIIEQEDATWRPISGAFDDSSDGSPLSVDLASIALDLLHTLAGYPNYALAELTVGDVRSLGVDVVPDPLPDNEAHAGIVGDKTKGIKRKLAKCASWRVPPDV